MADDVVIGIGGNTAGLDSQLSSSVAEAKLALNSVGEGGFGKLDQAVDQIAAAVGRLKQSAAGLQLIKAGQPEAVANVATRLEKASKAAAGLAQQFQKLDAGGLENAGKDAERLAQKMAVARAELANAVMEAQRLGAGGSGLTTLARQADELGLALGRIESAATGDQLRQNFSRVEDELNQAEKAAEAFSAKLRKIDSAKAGEQIRKGFADVDEELKKAEKAAAAFDSKLAQIANSTPNFSKLVSSLARVDDELTKAQRQFNRLLKDGVKTDAAQKELNQLGRRIIELSRNAHDAVADFGQLGTSAAASLDKIKQRATEAARAVSEISKQRGSGPVFDGKSVRDFGASAEKASSSLSLMKTALLGLIGVDIASWIRETATASINAAAEFESLQIRMEGVAGSSEKAATAMQELDRIADDYGQSVGVLRDSYAKFVPAVASFTKESELQIALFEALSSGFKGMGANAERLKLAFDGVNQVAGSSNAQWEDLKQVFENVPGTLSLLAKELGVTQGELKEMTADGQVLAKDVLPALAIAMQKALGDNIAKQAEGTQAAFARVQNSILELQIALGDKLIPEVLQIINSFNKFGESESAISRIVGALQPLVDVLTLVGDLLSGNIDAAINDLLAALSGLVASFISSMEAIVDVLEGVLAKILDLIPGAEKVAKALRDGFLSAGFDKAAKDLIEVRDALRDNADEARKSGNEQESAAERLKVRQAELRAELERLRAQAKDTGAAMTGAFKDADKVAGDLSKTISKIFEGLGETEAQAKGTGAALSEALQPSGGGLDEFLRQLQKANTPKGGDSFGKGQELGGGDPFSRTAAAEWAERARQQLGIGLSNAPIAAPPVALGKPAAGGGSGVAEQAAQVTKALGAQSEALAAAFRALGPEAESAVSLLQGIDQIAQTGRASVEDLARKLDTLAAVLEKGGQAGAGLAQGIRGGLPQSQDQQQIARYGEATSEFSRAVNNLAVEAAAARASTTALGTGAASTSAALGAAGTASTAAGQKVAAAGSQAAATAPQWVTLADDTRALTNTAGQAGQAVATAGQQVAQSGAAVASTAPSWVATADGAKTLTNVAPAAGQAAVEAGTKLATAGAAVASAGQQVAASAPKWVQLNQNTQELVAGAPAAGQAVVAAGDAVETAGQQVAVATPHWVEISRGTQELVTSAPAAGQSVATLGDAVAAAGQRVKMAGDGVVAANTIVDQFGNTLAAVPPTAEAAAGAVATVADASLTTAKAAEDGGERFKVAAGKFAEGGREIAVGTAEFERAAEHVGLLDNSLGTFEERIANIARVAEQMGPLQEFGGSLETVGTSAQTASTGVQALATPLQEVATALSTTAEGSGLASTMGAIGEAATSAAEPVKSLAEPLQQSAAAVTEISSATGAGASLEALATSAETAVAPITAIAEPAKSLGDAVGTVAEKAPAAGEGMGQLAKGLEEANPGLTTGAEGLKSLATAAGELQSGIAAIPVSIEETTAALEELVSAQELLRSDFGATATAAREMIAVFDEVTAGIFTLQDSAEKAGEALKVLTGPDVIEAVKALAAAVGEVAAAAKSAAANLEAAAAAARNMPEGV